MREVTVVVLAGDGIGPEVVDQARRVVEAVAPVDGISITWVDHIVGGAAIDAFGKPLPDGVLDACKASDAVLLGAVGGPKWDSKIPLPRGPSRPSSRSVPALACSPTSVP